eukprot:1194882-Prorocentrum_minimum.AAC.2
MGVCRAPKGAACCGVSRRCRIGFTSIALTIHIVALTIHIIVPGRLPRRSPPSTRAGLHAAVDLDRLGDGQRARDDGADVPPAREAARPARAQALPGAPQGRA